MPWIVKYDHQPEELRKFWIRSGIVMLGLELKRCG